MDSAPSLLTTDNFSHLAQGLVDFFLFRNYPNKKTAGIQSDGNCYFTEHVCIPYTA